MRVNRKRLIDGKVRQKLNSQRLHNPVAANQSDVLPWQLYDRVTTAAAANTAAQYTFFQQPIGAAGKTKEDTNLEQVQRLPDPQWMNVTSIGFYFTTDMIKTDVDAFLNDYYYEFWVGQKVYSEGPLQCAPSGYGLYGVTTRNNEGGFSNGMPAAANTLDLRLPAPIGDGNTGVTILQGQQFNVRVIGTPFALAAAAAPTNGAGLNLMCFLVGIISRSVQ